MKPRDRAPFSAIVDRPPLTLPPGLRTRRLLTLLVVLVLPPALLVLYPRAPMAVIVGSDIAHAVPLTLVAGLGHWWLGSVDLALLTSLLSGSIPGIVLGSYLSAHIPDAVLRPILAVTLIVVGGRLVF